MASVDLSVYRRPVLSDYLRQNAEDEFNRRQKERQTVALEKRAAQAGAGQDPAAVKIVNDMQNAARASQDASLPPEVRAQAAHRYTLLNQVAKSFAIDRGMSADVPVDIYGNPQEPQQDPQAEWAQAVGGLENPSPMTGGMPRQTTQQGGVGIEPGYLDAQNALAAGKKGAETQAQKNVELRMNPQIAEATDAAAKRGQAQGTAQASVGKFSDELAYLKNSVDTLLAHPGFSSVVGARNITRGAIPFTDWTFAGSPAAGADALISNIKGKAFKQAFETLKGGGQITEAEGRAATDAIAALDKSVREEDFVANLQTLQNILETAKARMEGIAGGDFNAPTVLPSQNRVAPKKGMPRPPEIEFNLKRQGFTQEQINEYMKTRGLR